MDLLPINGVFIMKKCCFLILLVALMCLTGCGCSHEWTEASCTAPKVCSLCGATEGTELPHSWVEAACETPKTCSTCGLTEGEALGHKEGTWEAPAADYVNAVIRETCTCQRCGAVTQARETPITTLANEDGSYFLASAGEFFQRIQKAYEQINETVGTNFRAEETSADGQYYAVCVYDDDTDEAVAVYSFTTDGPSHVALADVDSKKVAVMAMEALGMSDTSYHFVAGLMVCDPAKDLQQARQSFGSLYQAAYGDGYYEENGLRYLVMFSKFAVSPLGTTAE